MSRLKSDVKFDTPDAAAWALSVLGGGGFIWHYTDFITGFLGAIVLFGVMLFFHLQNRRNNAAMDRMSAAVEASNRKQ